MKIQIHQSAPSFEAKDVFGADVNLIMLKGKTVYLAFERNAGCPVCNLHTHQLLKNASLFASKGVTVVLIYESSAAKLREYLGEVHYPFHFVSDPDNRLYNMYGVERSVLKVIRGMFNGVMNKVSEGNKLFARPARQDGHMDMIPAEFIIDRHGKIALAHYGRYMGDHYPIEKLFQVIA